MLDSPDMVEPNTVEVAGPEIAKAEPTDLKFPVAGPVVLIETKDELEAISAKLAKLTGPVAIDAERASGFKYSQRAYLVQIHKAGGAIYLIDPAAISPDEEPSDFTALQNAIAKDEWILHAATQDLPCLNRLGLYPAALFDTELASRIAGLERVGLGAACENLLNIRLAKEHSAVDWSTRPLREDWLNYAALDVDVLIALRLELSSLLEEQGKLEFALEEFEALTRFQPKPPKLEKWRSTTGINELKDTRSMAVVRSLWAARESLAEKLDVSPGRLIPDSAIVAAAKAAPKTKPELMALKTFNGRASRTFLDVWFSALQLGLNERDVPPMRLAPTGIPNHRTWATRYPAADLRLQQFRPVIAAVSEELNIPAENIVSPDFVRQVAWNLDLVSAADISNKLSELGARNWQVSLLAERLESALQADEHEAL